MIPTPTPPVEESHTDHRDTFTATLCMRAGAPGPKRDVALAEFYNSGMAQRVAQALNFLERASALAPCAE